MVLTEERLLDGLTDAQRRVVTTINGPVLVLAGPGSGKTTVVTRRVAYLIAQGIPPWQILALTFTNRAAGEMRHRIDSLLGTALGQGPATAHVWPHGSRGEGDLEAAARARRGLTVSTFHAFCARLLRRFASPTPAQVGSAELLEPRVSANFTIYDATDQRDAIKRALEASDLTTRNWTPSSVAAAISKAKNALLDADAYAAQAADFYTRSIARIFRAYERILRDSDALDFDDLLLRTAAMLRSRQAVRESLQQRFQYILIDEYQDTNHAQFVIAHALGAGHGERPNICVVGDADQSIYGWRGADIGNILEFEQHYPGAAVIPLGQNFRSTGHIVAAAAGLIEHNRRRRRKPLHTELDAGRRPAVITAEDEKHEASIVVSEFRRLHSDESIPWREMAVLYRMNALSRVLEDEFRSAQVPHVIARGTAFFERHEVKDAIAFLRLIVNPADEVSLRRIVNVPARGLGDVTISRLEIFAVDRQLRLLQALARADQAAGLSARAVNAATKFAAMIASWRDAAAASSGAGLGALVEQVIQQSGLEPMYAASRSEEDQERLENLGELISAAAKFVPPATEALPDAPSSESEFAASREDAGGRADVTLLDQLAAFLESITLVSDADAVDPANGSVTLLTLHAAKGLEFDSVAIVGLEMGLLPHARATDEGDLEEERRLCFVGMTRARRHLLLTRAAVRTHRGLCETTIPSPFLKELPPESIDQRSLAAHAPPQARSIDAGDRQTDEVWPEAEFDQTGGEAAGDRARAAAFPVGCLVRHPTFGVGRVESCEHRPRGRSDSVRVRFQASGMRTLILEHARLERVG
jgi:DNA helicase-2/ATP-dependent DNA helicase PcrA